MIIPHCHPSPSLHKRYFIHVYRAVCLESQMNLRTLKMNQNVCPLFLTTRSTKTLSAVEDSIQVAFLSSCLAKVWRRGLYGNHSEVWKALMSKTRGHFQWLRERSWEMSLARHHLLRTRQKGTGLLAEDGAEGNWRLGWKRGTAIRTRPPIKLLLLLSLVLYQAVSTLPELNLTMLQSRC